MLKFSSRPFVSHRLIGDAVGALLTGHSAEDVTHTAPVAACLSLASSFFVKEVYYGYFYSVTVI